MICYSCREAGNLAQASRTFDNSTATWMQQQAILLHQECRGGTQCDCQHQLTGVNWLEVDHGNAH